MYAAWFKSYIKVYLIRFRNLTYVITITVKKLHYLLWELILLIFTDKFGSFFKFLRVIAYVIVIFLDFILKNLFQSWNKFNLILYYS